MNYKYIWVDKEASKTVYVTFKTGIELFVIPRGWGYLKKYI